MMLSVIAAKLKQGARSDFRGWHYEAAIIVQAVSRYLTFPLENPETAPNVRRTGNLRKPGIFRRSWPSVHPMPVLHEHLIGRAGIKRTPGSSITVNGLEFQEQDARARGEPVRKC